MLGTSIAFYRRRIASSESAWIVIESFGSETRRSMEEKREGIWLNFVPPARSTLGILLFHYSPLL